MKYLIDEWVYVPNTGILAVMATAHYERMKELSEKPNWLNTKVACSAKENDATIKEEEQGKNERYSCNSGAT